jgi:hypothetical protein
VTCAYDRLWHLPELIGFLVNHQHQDIVLSTNPEATDLRVIGLYDLLDQFSFSSVTIETFNPFEHHDRYRIEFRTELPFLEEIVDIDAGLQIWNGSKVFMSLYGRPTAARLVIASHLFEHYRDISHIHVRYANTNDELEFFELDKAVFYDHSYVEPIGRMIRSMPLEIAPRTNYVPWGYDWSSESILTTKYQDIFVDVVGETFVDGCTFFPTEKIVRSILLKKPFLVYGSQDFMEYLRQMGFKTFYEYWDEDYDAYHGKERLCRMLKIIDQIAELPIGTLRQMLASMQGILDHNYNLVMQQTYNPRVKLIS